MTHFIETPHDIRCDHCNAKGPLSPNRGERLCQRCLFAAMDAELVEGFRVIEDGRPTVYRPGYVTPRAHAYRH